MTSTEGKYESSGFLRNTAESTRCTASNEPNNGILLSMKARYENAVLL